MSRKWMLRWGAAVLVLAAGIGTTTAVAGATSGTDHILRGEKLVANAQQKSNNGAYQLIQQKDGNLVEYRTKDRKVMWSTGTSGAPGAYTTLQKDGNLVVTRGANQKPLWKSGTDGSGATELVVQNDGNVVLYAGAGRSRAVWATQGASLPGGPGPQSFTQSAAAAAAEREVGSTRQTGWNQPGECMVSVRRWIQNAGGRMAGGGVMDTFRNSPAKQVATGNRAVVNSAARGDVIQYVHNGNPQGFEPGVHTVMVVGNNGDGTLSIVQSNARYDGKVTAVKRWTPGTPSGFTAYLWRFGR